VNGEQTDLFDGGAAGPPGWSQDGRLRRLIDNNFVRYAAYVIRDRAIPDLADGLKPVQRRILHSLSENDDGKLIKVANIVGHTMQYHPHGDASIADALVVLANKDYVIEGQGNFGNVFTGDPAAASRYIECRLTELARSELFNPELTRFVPSYDGRRKEPVCLPCKLPLLLMMGAEGIAVGLSTRILPHNFGELLSAQIAILEGKPFEVLPDFKQGGLMEASEYDRGRGRVRLRAEIEQCVADGSAELIIHSVPYGSTTDSMIASIEAAARKKKLAIKSIDDFTAEKVEIRIELKPGQDTHKAVHALYAFTQCEMTLSSRIVVIHKNRPVEMDVEQVLRHNTRQLVTTLRRELEAERRKHLEQIQAKTLVQIFVENRIYKRIEQCTTLPEVQQAVLDGVKRFCDKLLRDVTHKDVEMLLGIKIKRISRYDMSRNRKEIDDLQAGVVGIESNLNDITGHTVRYLRSIRRKYAKDYPRRTQAVEVFDSIAVRDLTADELTLRYDRERGYLGHEVPGEELFRCSSLDKVMVVRADGRYKVINPPDKLFVDRDMPWCGPTDRDRVIVMVYREEDGLLYIKRFTFGGTILNREYASIPARCRVEFFSAEDPQLLYVRYNDGGGQLFNLKKVPARAVRTLGWLLTSKPVKSIDVEKPEDWSDRRFGRPRLPLGMRK
jgi:topoisomerase-4 subunit A